MKKWLYVIAVALVVASSVFLNGCGKDTGSGVGGKVIITGAGQ